MKLKGALIAFVTCAAVFVASAREYVVGIADICRTNDLSEVKPDYPAAVYASGATPYVLPCTTNAEAIAALLDCVDMLLLAGGEDVEPSRYGEKRDAKLGRLNLRRDALKFALARKMPIAGVCHGSQIINKFMGGTLEFTPQWKDKERKAEILHKPVPWKENYHTADLVEGSRFARIMGEKRVKINSYHTMRSVKMAPGLKVTARASDGVIEAFEHETLPIMAFQFHPERMTDDPRFIELMRAALSFPGTMR